MHSCGIASRRVSSNRGTPSSLAPAASQGLGLGAGGRSKRGEEEKEGEPAVLPARAWAWGQEASQGGGEEVGEPAG